MKLDDVTAGPARLDVALRVEMEVNNRLRADLQAAMVTIAALRDELAAARRNAFADALEEARNWWPDSSTDYMGWEIRALLAERLAEVRAGKRTIPRQDGEASHG